ncbi:MAG TPA: xanthine dehydrogenase family protein subunit M [Thermoanaerobaculia bacterium]|jgi:xanthine dehydrogenase YagS FAD-binding subunit|nr:xanthine dehydrogenase family protein subunit M [Thermoanaerobaculia bacterium]
MRAFEYASPTTAAQALKLLTPGSAPLAGGSDLLALMKDEVETPNRLVNLKDLRDLQGIRWDPKVGLRIGALTTIDEVASEPTLKFDYSALAEAFGRVAGPQIRNVATVGGNLCQRPRCWYFRNGFGLLPMKDGKSMAVEGDNRYHAIFGDGPAYFVTPSTVAPLLVALGTQIAVLGPQGERRMELERFFRIPQKEGEREHDLAPGEIVTEIVVPPISAASGLRVASYEVRQRETLDWSLATASVVLDMDGATVKRARVVLGQVAPIPWTAKATEELLAGKTLDRALAEKAGEAAIQGAKPLSRNRYKVQLARVAVKRALLEAAGMEA